MSQYSNDASGDEVDTTQVAVKTVAENQLIEGRSYVDAVSKGKKRKLRIVIGDSIFRKYYKIINKGMT